MGPKRFSLGFDKSFEESYRKVVYYTFVHFYLASGRHDPPLAWIYRNKNYASILVNECESDFVTF